MHVLPVVYYNIIQQYKNTFMQKKQQHEIVQRLLTVLIIFY